MRVRKRWIATTEGRTLARTDWTSPMRRKTLVFGEKRTTVVFPDRIAAATPAPTPAPTRPPTSAAISTT